MEGGCTVVGSNSNAPVGCSVFRSCLPAVSVGSCDVTAHPQTVRHGFPYQPSALAFDPVQKILAVGTQTGALRLYPFFF